MAERITRELIAEKAIVHDVLPLHQPTTVDRSFELPGGLYVATAALFFGFLAVMAMGFGNPALILPMAIFVVFIAMFFAVPAMWMRMKPEQTQRLTPWGRFQREGVMTPFGHVTAGAAAAQVLVLPALVFMWGVAVVTIAALVR